MTATIDDIRAEIRVESRAAGFRSNQPVDSRQITTRRRQIAVVALLVFFGVVFSTMRAELWGTSDGGLIDADLAKSLMITFAGGFLAYVVEKERHLRRLDDLGERERELHLAAAEQILENAAFSEADSDLHGSLLLEDVLDKLLQGAVELSAASAGTLFLVRDDNTPTLWTKLGEASEHVSIASRVAQMGKPLLVNRSGHAVVSGGVKVAAPVRVNDVLIGVVALDPSPGRSFDAIDQELLDRFCVRSGRALANSCAYEDALMLGLGRND